MNETPTIEPQGRVTPDVNQSVNPPAAAPQEFDPYRNEGRGGADAPPPDILPEADADDEIDLERTFAGDAGMRDGGLTGSIEEER